MMERIEQTKAVGKLTKHQQFSCDALVNHKIKTGGWRKLHIDGMITTDDMCEAMVEGFELDDVVCHRLKFHYKDWAQGATKKKTLKKLEDCDALEIETTKKRGHDGSEIVRRLEDGTVCLVKLADLHPGVRYLKGDMVISDINCDSEYMLDVMPGVGAAIRKA